MSVRRRSRLGWLVGIGSLLIVFAIAYQYFFLARPVGDGPAGPSVSRDAFEQTWTLRRVHVLGLGDSVTAGLGAHSPQRSYFQRVLRNPPNDFPDLKGLCLSAVLPNLTEQNLAQSGSTSLQHQQLIEERLTMQEEDVFGLVFMTTGGNDLIHSYGRSPPREGAMYGATLEQAQPWIENFEVRLNGMLDAIAAAFPGGHEVYLADIYDPTDGVGDAPSIFLPDWPDGLAIHAQYNAIIHRVGEQRDEVHIVPMYRLFLGHGSHCRQFWREHYDANDPTHWFYSNVEDPNDRGYDAIRRLFLNTISEATRLRRSDEGSAGA